MALADEDRPDDVKRAESLARADALLELDRNPPPVEDDDPPEPQSAEVWLRYLLPVPHSSSLVTLQLCGYGDAGFRIPLAETSRVVAAATL